MTTLFLRNVNTSYLIYSRLLNLIFLHLCDRFGNQKYYHSKRVLIEILFGTYLRLKVSINLFTYYDDAVLGHKNIK